jgi:ketosteroid isomerase-like protein
MSSQTLEVFHRWHAAHQAADSDTLLRILLPDVTVRSLFQPRPVHGRDDAVAHFRRTLARFPDLSMPLLSPAAANVHDVVFAEVRFTGHFHGSLTWLGQTHHGTGQEFDVDGVAVLQIQDGGVQAVRTLFDRDTWLLQIGIGPAPAPPFAHLPDGPDGQGRPR